MRGGSILQLLNAYLMDWSFLNKDLKVKTIWIHLIFFPNRLLEKKCKGKFFNFFFFFCKAINLICFEEKIN